MKCSLNNTHSMSEYCLQDWNLLKLNETSCDEECRPKYMWDYYSFTAIFCIINSIIGKLPF